MWFPLLAGDRLLLIWNAIAAAALWSLFALSFRKAHLAYGVAIPVYLAATPVTLIVGPATLLLGLIWRILVICVLAAAISAETDRLDRRRAPSTSDAASGP